MQRARGKQSPNEGCEAALPSFPVCSCGDPGCAPELPPCGGKALELGGGVAPPTAPSPPQGHDKSGHRQQDPGAVETPGCLSWIGLLVPTALSPN